MYQGEPPRHLICGAFSHKVEHRLAAAAPAPFSSPIPWRKTGLRYNNNEIYFDIIEELEATVGR